MCMSVRSHKLDRPEPGRVLFLQVCADHPSPFTKVRRATTFFVSSSVVPSLACSSILWPVPLSKGGVYARHPSSSTHRLRGTAFLQPGCECPEGLLHSSTRDGTEGLAASGREEAFDIVVAPSSVPLFLCVPWVRGTVAKTSPRSHKTVAHHMHTWFRAVETDGLGHQRSQLQKLHVCHRHDDTKTLREQKLA